MSGDDKLRAVIMACFTVLALGGIVVLGLTEGRTAAAPPSVQASPMHATVIPTAETVKELTPNLTRYWDAEMNVVCYQTKERVSYPSNLFCIRTY